MQPNAQVYNQNPKWDPLCLYGIFIDNFQCCHLIDKEQQNKLETTTHIDR